MATDGVFVPEGGVYEIVLSLERLARRAGVEVKTDEAVREIWRGRIVTEEGEYQADRVVSDLDAGQAGALAGPRKSVREGEIVLLRGGRLRDA